MDSDSEKENYFSLYMKRKKNELKKQLNFRSDKKGKNNCASIQKLKENNKKNDKLLLENSEKRNKEGFSFIKSYLFNFKDPKKNKKSYCPEIKNIAIDKTKLKSIRVNKSSTDINYQRKIIPKSNSIKNKNAKDNPCPYDKNNSIDLKKKNNYMNNDKKIEKLKKRIFDLMNVIDNFEKDYINSNKPLQIKEQLNKINCKIVSYNQQIKNSKKKINNNYINEHLYITDRINYHPNKKLKSNCNKNYIKLNEELDICNYYDYDYDNKILTKIKNSSNRNPRPGSSKISDKNKPIIMINFKQNNISKNNNISTFMKLISSNSSSNNELNKTNSNLNNNKKKNSTNQIKTNTSLNKMSFNNKDNKNQKESNIFKRRINYSNFINQKMKQNIIIHRNQEFFSKQNMANKSRYSYNNSNNSNGCNNMKINMNNYYYNVDNFKDNSNKNNSLDKNVQKLNYLNNNFIDNQKPRINNQKGNDNNNELCNHLINNEYSNNYFLSENRDNNNINNKILEN